MRDLQMLRQELKDARQEVRNLTVMAMRPDMSPAKAELVLKGLRSARAEVKLRVMALNYQLSKESRAPRLPHLQRRRRHRLGQVHLRQDHPGLRGTGTQIQLWRRWSGPWQG
jgi:hypothetical protein